MEALIKQLERERRMDEKVTKFTELNDEKSISHGILIFLTTTTREYKILIPAPFHEDLLQNAPPSYRKVLKHPQAMLLK